MADTEQAAATLETRADVKDSGGTAADVNLWLQAIDLADKAEKPWREAAQKAIDTYELKDAVGDKAKDRQSTFNVLYSTVDTLAPALYNSLPVPDIRRRFGDTDPQAKAIAEVMERGISFSVDEYDLNGCLEAAVLDMLLPGRAVTRVKYAPVPGKGGEVEYESTYCEPVYWKDFRHGPARKWADVPWIAFRHMMTRDQLVALSPQQGNAVPLESTVDGVDENDKALPDLFKRAEVWEVWDKENAERLFIARSHKAAPLLKEPDPLKLKGFFPVPPPLLAIKSPGSLLPVEPYRMWRDQAEELSEVSRRITKLIKVLKWRGVRASEIPDLDKVADQDDGELVASEGVMSFLTNGGKLENAIWLMPIDQAIKVVESLVIHREQIKQVIYEINGVADILRGAVDPREKAAQSQLKAQWGSLRLSRMQAEVQRYARDLIRMLGEIIAEKFQPGTLALITGVEPQALAQAMPVLKSQARDFRVDIETDSTIQADTARAQRNVAEFVTGFSGFIEAVGPAVQAGVMPLDVATDLLTSFARNFKLGRQATDALERLGQAAKQQPQQQVGAEAQDNGAEAQVKAQVEMAREQGRQQTEAMKVELARGDQAIEAQRLNLDREQFDWQRQKDVADYQLREREAMNPPRAQ